jgi:hypothetical protein
MITETAFATIDDFEQWVLGAEQGASFVYLKNVKGAYYAPFRGVAAYARALQHLGLAELVQQRVSKKPGTFNYIALRTKKGANGEVARRAKVAAGEELDYA